MTDGANPRRAALREAKNTVGVIRFGTEMWASVGKERKAGRPPVCAAGEVVAQRRRAETHQYRSFLEPSAGRLEEQVALRITSIHLKRQRPIGSSRKQQKWKTIHVSLITVACTSRLKAVKNYDNFKQHKHVRNVLK